MREIRAHLGRDIEVLSMDACLMQMLEVAWELKGTCRFIVASEEMEPGNGYPYHHLLKGLSSKVTTKRFLKHWVDVFVAAYNGGCYGTEECTLSALDMSRIDGIKVALDRLARLVLAGSARTELGKALKACQAYSEPAHIDIGDFARCLQKQAKAGSELRVIAAGLAEKVDQAVVHSRSVADSMSRSRGLALYFPQSMDLWYPTYLKLQFSKDSAHDELVQDFLARQAATADPQSVHEGYSSFSAFGQERLRLYRHFEELHTPVVR